MTVTQGDAGTLQFRCKLDDDSYADLGGASYESRIVGADGNVIVIPNSAHTTDEDATSDFVRIAFTVEQSRLFKLGPRINVNTTVTQGPAIQTYHGTFAVRSRDPRQPYV